jgi:hypothetical protein
MPQFVVAGSDRSRSSQKSKVRSVFGLSADKSTCTLLFGFADVGLRGFLNRSDFILQHDEAIL